MSSCLLASGPKTLAILCSHVYPDVPPALERWRQAGIDLRIYSSGSVAAQKQFFGRTDFGDLGKFFSGNYDTTIGPKRSLDSYIVIAHDMNCSPSALLFLSDVPAELDAARGAGWQTGLVERIGNAPVPENVVHPRIQSFEQIDVQSIR